MLKDTHLTLFQPKNWKKAGIFTKVASNFGALALIFIELWPFARHNL